MSHLEIHSLFKKTKLQSTLLLSGALFVLVAVFDVLAGANAFSDLIKALAIIAIAITSFRLMRASHTNVTDNVVLKTQKEANPSQLVLDTQDTEVDNEQHPEPELDIQPTLELNESAQNLSVRETAQIQKEPEKHHEKKVHATHAPIQVEPHVSVQEPEAMRHEKHESQQSQEPASKYDELLETLLAHENKERGTKQKEFFSHQNNAADREYLGVNIAKIVTLSEEYHSHITLAEVQEMLSSTIHEHRIMGVWLLVQKYSVANRETKQSITEFYMTERSGVDNWDMTDLAARNIIGSYTHEFEDDQYIEQLIASDSLWDKRSALMATHTTILDGETTLGLFVIEKVHHIQDELVQSAIGWVLKELYKQAPEMTEDFIKQYFNKLSKQAIRIGTERMEKEERKAFLRGEFDKVRI